MFPDRTEQFAGAVATGQAAVKMNERENGLAPDKVPDLYAANVQPPRIVKAIVLFQAQVRVKKFIRQFGPNALETHADYAPPSPQVQLALFLCRRLVKPKFCNIDAEASGVAAVLSEKQHLSLRMIGDALNRYARCMNMGHPAIRMMEEKAHIIKVDVLESLAFKFSEKCIEDHRDAARESVSLYMRNSIDKVIDAFDIPNADLDECTGRYEAFLVEELQKKDHVLSERLRVAANSYEIRKIEKEALFELRGSREKTEEFLHKVDRAIMQRKQFLESELITRWDYPLHGVIGPYEFAYKQYASELGPEHPQVCHFGNEVEKLSQKYEAKFTEQSEDIASHLNKLELDKRNAPQVKSVIAHFDAEIQKKIDEAHDHIHYWGNLFGFDKKAIFQHTTRLCSPRTTNHIYSQAVRRCVGEVRMALSEGITESRDQKAIARYQFLKNYMHTLMDMIAGKEESMDAEIEGFREEIPDVRFQQRLGHDDANETELLLNADELSTNTNVDPSKMKEHPDLPTGFEPIETGYHDTYGDKSFAHLIDKSGYEKLKQGELGQFDPRLNTKSDYTQTLDMLSEFEKEGHDAGWKKSADGLLPYETVKGGLPGTAVQLADDLAVLDADGKSPRTDEHANDRLVAQMTLHDMHMDDLSNFSEQVLQKKFSRALAGVCDVDQSRIRVLAFRPGSVKIIFEVLPPEHSLTDVSDDPNAPPPQTTGVIYNRICDQIEHPDTEFRSESDVTAFVHDGHVSMIQVSSGDWDENGEINVLSKVDLEPMRIIPDTTARNLPIELSAADAPGPGAPPLPMPRAVDLGPASEPILFGTDLLVNAEAIKPGSLADERPKTTYASTSRYANAPKSLLYESGSWCKVQDVLGVPNYKSYPPPTAEDIDQMLMEKVVFFRPTTAPAGKPTLATPLSRNPDGALKEKIDFDNPLQERVDITPYPKQKSYQMYDEERVKEPGNSGTVMKFNPFASFAVTRFPANAPKQVRDAQTWGTVAQMQLRNVESLCEDWIPSYQEKKRTPGWDPREQTESNLDRESRQRRHGSPDRPAKKTSKEQGLEDSIASPPATQRAPAGKKAGREEETPKKKSADGMPVSTPLVVQDYSPEKPLAKTLAEEKQGRRPSSEKEAEEAAALKVQKVQRGNQARKRVSEIKRTGTDPVEIREMANEYEGVVDPSTIVQIYAETGGQVPFEEVVEETCLANVEAQLAKVGITDPERQKEFILQQEPKLDEDAENLAKSVAEAGELMQATEEVLPPPEESAAVLENTKRSWKLAARTVRRVSPTFIEFSASKSLADGVPTSKSMPPIPVSASANMAGMREWDGKVQPLPSKDQEASVDGAVANVTADGDSPSEASAHASLSGAQDEEGAPAAPQPRKASLRDLVRNRISIQKEEAPVKEPEQQEKQDTEAAETYVEALVLQIAESEDISEGEKGQSGTEDAEGKQDAQSSSESGKRVLPDAARRLSHASSMILAGKATQEDEAIAQQAVAKSLPVHQALWRQLSVSGLVAHRKTSKERQESKEKAAKEFEAKAADKDPEKLSDSGEPKLDISEKPLSDEEREKKETEGDDEKKPDEDGENKPHDDGEKKPDDDGEKKQEDDDGEKKDEAGKNDDSEKETEAEKPKEPGEDEGAQPKEDDEPAEPREEEEKRKAKGGLRFGEDDVVEIPDRHAMLEEGQKSDDNLDRLEEDPVEAPSIDIARVASEQDSSMTSLTEISKDPVENLMCDPHDGLGAGVSHETVSDRPAVRADERDAPRSTGAEAFSPTTGRPKTVQGSRDQQRAPDQQFGKDRQLQFGKDASVERYEMSSTQKESSVLSRSPGGRDRSHSPGLGSRTRSPSTRAASQSRSPSPKSRVPSPPPVDMTHRKGITSWVGMLSGLQGSGLRGPIAQADEKVTPQAVSKALKKSGKQPSERLQDLVSPAYVRQLLRQKIVGLGPPYNTTGTKADVRTKTPAINAVWTYRNTRDKVQDKQDWSRSYQHVRSAFDAVGGKSSLPRLQLGPAPMIKFKKDPPQPKTLRLRKPSATKLPAVQPTAKRMQGAPAQALRKKKEEEAAKATAGLDRLPEREPRTPVASPGIDRELHSPERSPVIPKKKSEDRESEDEEKSDEKDEDQPKDKEKSPDKEVQPDEEGEGKEGKSQGKESKSPGTEGEGAEEGKEGDGKGKDGESKETDLKKRKKAKKEEKKRREAEQKRIEAEHLTETGLDKPEEELVVSVVAFRPGHLSPLDDNLNSEPDDDTTLVDLSPKDMAASSATSNDEKSTRKVTKREKKEAKQLSVAAYSLVGDAILEALVLDMEGIPAPEQLVLPPSGDYDDEKISLIVEGDGDEAIRIQLDPDMTLEHFACMLAHDIIADVPEVREYLETLVVPPPPEPIAEAEAFASAILGSLGEIELGDGIPERVRFGTQATLEVPVEGGVAGAQGEPFVPTESDVLAGDLRAQMIQARVEGHCGGVNESVDDSTGIHAYYKTGNQAFGKSMNAYLDDDDDEAVPKATSSEATIPGTVPLEGQISPDGTIPMSPVQRGTIVPDGANAILAAAASGVAPSVGVAAVQRETIVPENPVLVAAASGAQIEASPVAGHSSTASPDPVETRGATPAGADMFELASEDVVDYGDAREASDIATDMTNQLLALSYHASDDDDETRDN